MEKSRLVNGEWAIESLAFKKEKQGARHYFSIMHLSGGITRPLGKIGDLRIEPYFKIPLTGLGSGKLPLLSTGIHLGITRKLF